MFCLHHHHNHFLSLPLPLSLSLSLCVCVSLSLCLSLTHTCFSLSLSCQNVQWAQNRNLYTWKQNQTLTINTPKISLLLKCGLKNNNNKKHLSGSTLPKIPPKMTCYLHLIKATEMEYFVYWDCMFAMSSLDFLNYCMCTCSITHAMLVLGILEPWAPAVLGKESMLNPCASGLEHTKDPQTVGNWWFGAHKIPPGSWKLMVQSTHKIPRQLETGSGSEHAKDP